MKFFSFLKFDILQLVSYCKSPLKCASTQAMEKAKSNQKPLYLRKRKKVQLYTPVLENKKLQALTSICGITLSINHVSWAKIFIPALTVLDWGAYSLPLNFINRKHESNNSLLAISIRQNIPNADLYVMENQTKWTSSLNEINLKAMLVLLLSLDKDVPVQDKVIFQRASVLNCMHKLLVGNERKSMRPIIKNLLKLIKTQNDPACSNEETPDWYSQLEISQELKNCFTTSSLEKQESLSIALLVALSFLNKNFLENSEKFKMST